jgi:two-component system, cell cycle response regulator DivK
MNKCILVVEDQEDNRRILRDLFANAGYELIEAESGEEALTALTARRPDLILMDIQLPVMDGYEATRRIRLNPELKSIPIIAMTAYALAGDEVKALAAGCTAYVTKPFRRCKTCWADASTSCVSRFPRPSLRFSPAP